MDLFNRKALAQKEEEICVLRKEMLELKAKLSGERVCGSYCSRCKHGIKNTNPFATYWTCDLECKCKDFAEK